MIGVNYRFLDNLFYHTCVVYGCAPFQKFLLIGGEGGGGGNFPVSTPPLLKRLFTAANPCSTA